MNEQAAWTKRVEHGDEFALVVEWPGKPPHGRYWWVLCPAAATLHVNPPTVDEDPTSPDDHSACSLSPECDFHELHVLAHQAIRERAAARPAPEGVEQAPPSIELAAAEYAAGVAGGVNLTDDLRIRLIALEAYRVGATAFAQRPPATEAAYAENAHTEAGVEEAAAPHLRKDDE